MDNTDQNVPHEPAPETASSGAKGFIKKNKFGVIIGLVILALLVAIGVLASMLMSDSSDNNQNNSTNTSQSGDVDNEEDAGTSERKIARTVNLDSYDTNLEMVIYEPEETATNVMVNYAIRNTCDGCSRTTRAAIGDLGISKSNAYLLDNESGTKHNVIKDQDGIALATHSCVRRLAGGESLECFIAFTKPAPGAEYSIYFGGTLPPIDGFRMPN